MGKALISRITLYSILTIATIFIAGCPSMTLVYPELIHYNTFTLSKQWIGKYVTTVEVYDETANSEPLTEPVWMIRATQRVPAERLVVRVGFTPNGFEQVDPEFPQEFEPVDGRKYFILIKLEPVDEDMFFVLKPWTASSIPQINLPEEDQPYIHPASKIKFPKYVGFFMRGQISRYDKAGNDISVAYYLPPVSGVTTTTVYLYPATDYENNPINLKTHYDKIKETIEAHYYKSTIISDEEIQIVQKDNIYHGFCATFSITNQSSSESSAAAVLSKLYLFRHGEWFIKYRFTYPQNSKDHIEKEIDRFLESLIWPELN